MSIWICRLMPIMQLILKYGKVKYILHLDFLGFDSWLPWHNNEVSFSNLECTRDPRFLIVVQFWSPLRSLEIEKRVWKTQNFSRSQQFRSRKIYQREPVSQGRNSASLCDTSKKLIQKSGVACNMTNFILMENFLRTARHQGKLNNKLEEQVVIVWRNCNLHMTQRLLGIRYHNIIHYREKILLQEIFKAYELIFFKFCYKDIEIE